MVAVFYRYGRLGNRLFTFSNLIAFAEYSKVPIMVPAFSEYRASFPFFRDSSACVFLPESSSHHDGYAPFLMSLLARIGLIPTVRFWEDRHVFFDQEDSHDPRVSAMITSPNIVFEGWNFRSRHAIMKSRSTICRVFRPSESIEESATRRIEEARKTADVTIGVHVRWGDYQGSDLYFTKEEYALRMSELRSLLRPSKVGFVLFCADRIDTEGLPKDSRVCPPGTPEEDLFSLAKCDYLLGPPSTFSMWASFYGGHPLFVMRHGVDFTDISFGTVATP